MRHKVATTSLRESSVLLAFLRTPSATHRAASSRNSAGRMGKNRREMRRALRRQDRAEERNARLMRGGEQ